MATEPASSRFNQQSLLGIIASLATVVAVGFLLNVIPGASPQVQGSALAVAAGLPAAFAYAWQGRHRDTTHDAALIRQGQLRRPIALVVAMLASTLYMVFMGVLVGLIFISTKLQVYSWADLRGWVLLVWAGVIVGAGMFFIVSYASHYLGKHPYLWTVVAVVCFWAFRLTLTLLVTIHMGSIEAGYHGAFTGTAFLQEVLAALFVLAVGLAGAWYGRKFRYQKFLAKKLARTERKASRAAATQQHSTTLNQTSSTDLPAPNAAAPQQPPPASGPDLLDQLKKLGDLRDAGVITDEEFQAKKTEILARI